MRNPKRNETVVMAWCQQSRKPFGITAEIRNREIDFKWAFKMSESTSSKEGFDRTRVSGNIFTTADYPGCPHCGAKSWYQCSNGHFVCMESGKTGWVKCPKCGVEGELKIADNFDLSGGDL